jgi:hypothetical protein
MRINGTEIKTPTLKVSTFVISNSERTADGTMVMDIIAEKRRLDLTWTIIRDTELEQVMALLSGQVFHTVTYPDPARGEETTITVYRGDAGQDVGQRVAGTRYWQNVTLAFIER